MCQTLARKTQIEMALGTLVTRTLMEMGFSTSRYVLVGRVREVPHARDGGRKPVKSPVYTGHPKRWFPRL